MNIYDEPKIDCHNHIFDPIRHPYRADTLYSPAGQEVGTVEQFRRVLDAYGVRHALLVGPTSGYRSDNRYLLQALDAGDGRFKGIAVVEDDISLDQLAALKARGVVGVAFNPATEGLAVMANTAGLFGRLDELDMFAQIQTREDELPELDWLIKGNRTALLIDHCGRPSVGAGLEQAGFRYLLNLAASGRACVKLSGMQKFCDADHLFDESRAYVHSLLETFGAHACMWGSDWPFLRMQSRIDYGVLLKLAEQLLPDPAIRRQVMWETPRTLFGFDNA